MYGRIMGEYVTTKIWGLDIYTRPEGFVTDIPATVPKAGAIAALPPPLSAGLSWLVPDQPPNPGQSRWSLPARATRHPSFPESLSGAAPTWLAELIDRVLGSPLTTRNYSLGPFNWNVPSTGRSKLPLSLAPQALVAHAGFSWPLLAHVGLRLACARRADWARRTSPTGSCSC